jgi:hypothetical protein
MKLEIFVEQPNIELKEGIKVTKETDIEYSNEKVTQTLKDLVLNTTVKDEGTNGFNTYKSTSNIELLLNEGDILLFHEERGYYMPPYPVETIDDAISDINSLSDIPRFKEGD